MDASFRPPASVLAVAVAAAVWLQPLSARAQVVGGDIPLLTGILTILAKDLPVNIESLAEVQKDVKEGAQLVGYAGDAVQAYNQFKGLNAKLFAQNLEDALEAAYPDIGVLVNQASHLDVWDQGTGALQYQLVMCFNDENSEVMYGTQFADLDGGGIGPSSKCAAIRQGLKLNQISAALTQVFGSVVPLAGASETVAADHEAAKAIQAAQNIEQTSSINRTQAAVLLKQCTESKDAAACVAAGNTASIRSIAVTTAILDQAAEANRLQAMRVAQESARRKREINEPFEQHQELFQFASGEFALSLPTIDTEGFDLTNSSATGSP